MEGHHVTMNAAYRNAIGNAGAALITHLGLVDRDGAELSGGSPAYARLAVTWTGASGGMIRPATDKTFNVPVGATVAGWRGYSALSGGTEYGGEDLTPEAFAGQGEYRLIAAQTGISHGAA
jgi:hypothetical protein